MMQLSFSLVLVLASIFIATCGAEVQQKCETRTQFCYTDLATTKVYHVPTTTHHFTKTATKFSTKYTKIRTTFTPRPHTITTTKTLISTATAAGPTDTDLATVTTTIVTTTTSVASANTVTVSDISTMLTTSTTTTTPTMSTATNFVPVQSSLPNSSDDDPSEAESDDVQIVQRNLANIRRIRTLTLLARGLEPEALCKNPQTKYPAKVLCNHYFTKTVTRTITRTDPPCTTTARPSTITSTISKTSTTTTTSLPSSITATSTSTTVSTVTVMTTPTTTTTFISIVTLTTTSTSTANTFYAQCTAANFADKGSGPNVVDKRAVPYLTGVIYAETPTVLTNDQTPLGCCIACANLAICGAFSLTFAGNALGNNSCVLVSESAFSCSAGLIDRYAVENSASMRSAVVGNGACGQITSAGQF